MLMGVGGLPTTGSAVVQEVPNRPGTLGLWDWDSSGVPHRLVRIFLELIFLPSELPIQPVTRHLPAEAQFLSGASARG